LWLENVDGNGTFITGGYLCTVDQEPFEMYPADLDDDGDEDLVIVQENLIWLENEIPKDGTCTAHVISPEIGETVRGNDNAIVMIDLMEATGTDGIDTLDPPPLGTVDLRRAIEILGKRVFIKGNMDPVHTVLEGTAEDVLREAHERLEIARPGGAYILSTACSVAPATPPENLMAMRDAVDKWESY
jgi:hypothetical protein